MLYSEQSVWNLRNVHLFENLPPEELRALSPFLNVRRHRRGEFIFHAGEKADRLYFVDKGSVKISMFSINGEERVLDVLRAGDTFGELFLSRDKSRATTAQALTDTTLWTMAEEKFMEFVQFRPDLCLSFIRHLVDQQRRTLARMDTIMHVPSGPRLLAVLLDLAERCAGREGDCYFLPRGLTQEDMARMAGLNRSTVSVLINEYRRKGILGGEGGTLSIHLKPVRAFLKKAGLIHL
jgi:CRP-like cAMP-binding protein